MRQGASYLYERYIWPALEESGLSAPERAAGGAASLHTDFAPAVAKATSFLATVGTTTTVGAVKRSGLKQ